MNRMRRGALFAVALMLVGPLAAAPVRKAPPKATPKPPAEAKLIQSCEAHKFETVVDTTVDGQPHKSKVKLCGVEGQSDADWLGTLRDAISKLEANKEMAPATRDQIVAAIKAEIARLSIVASPVPTKREVQQEGASSLARDYAALPPLPPAPETVQPAQPRALVPTGGPPVSTVPVPGPAAIPPAATVSVAPPPTPLVAMPRLKISCESPSDAAGSGPCVEFDRDTRITIRADGEMPQGTALQFVRNGQVKGEVSLGGLARGAALRSGLPTPVCAGFGAGRLELRITRPGTVEAAQSEGPYPLRC